LSNNEPGDRNTEEDGKRNRMSERPMTAQEAEVAEAERTSDCVNVRQNGAQDSCDPVRPSSRCRSERRTDGGGGKGMAH
jgi:hypothetical protein